MKLIINNGTKDAANIDNLNSVAYDDLVNITKSRMGKLIPGV